VLESAISLQNYSRSFLQKLGLPNVKSGFEIIKGNSKEKTNENP
jgi:hypothetical protein